jgi:hypothetical protein
MFDITSIIYVLAIIGILILLLILKKESSYPDFNEENKITKNKIYTFTIDSIYILRYLYISNRTIEGNKFLTKIKDNIIYLNEIQYLDFNKRNKLMSEVLELKNLLLSLNAFKINEDKLINEIIKILESHEHRGN